MSLLGQVHPVRLIQLGPNEVVEIPDLLVLPDQGSYKQTRVLVLASNDVKNGKLTSQTELGMCLHSADTLPELVGGRYVHLI